MKVKEESEKVSLKLNIQKIKIMASGPITSWQIDGEAMQTVRDSFPSYLHNYATGFFWFVFALSIFLNPVWIFLYALVSYESFVNSLHLNFVFYYVP